MKNLPNIEKSKFHKGEYVGYNAAGVWRIERLSYHSWGKWRAVSSCRQWLYYGFTLADLSAKLKAREVKNV